MIEIQKDEAAIHSMRQNGRERVAEQCDITVVNRLLLTLAPIALASNSSQDLASRLLTTTGITSVAPPGLYPDLLDSAGLN